MHPFWSVDRGGKLVPLQWPTDCIGVGCIHHATTSGCLRSFPVAFGLPSHSHLGCDGSSGYWLSFTSCHGASFGDDLGTMDYGNPW